ncbi:DUF1698 domain-containing protein [Candidatus Venteria ishoeyi]|uniref:class I SAM-dependent methyltransferase n=1 Tax=Candidatus Venteria ishoeyi TaxID=1899563 RepID=UPI0025A551CF|nr:DUF1698 domain-containing protein [Candidatus Venteria ishoeyi]MDM8545251.1 DUF1698 domain-containing protein [Candidatus Venteria ishoeyi]
MPSNNILDAYITNLPTPQNALNLFQGEWRSKLPEAYAPLKTTGQAGLFEDDRIAWMLQQIGDISGQDILELGPLEAGHSYMLEQAGAASVTSIEANTRAYLKCLVMKEVLELQRVCFLLGDFVTWLRREQVPHFDLSIASGVLYHMKNPVELLELLAKTSDRLFIWTHYYDKEILANNPNIPADKFAQGQETSWAGFQHTLYPQDYQAALNWNGFCGGPETSSCWLPRQTILDALVFFGFKNIQIYGEATAEHPNGPCFSLLASKE